MGQPPIRPGYNTYSSYQPSYRHDQSFVNGNPINDVLTPDFVRKNYLAGLSLLGTATNEDLFDIIQQKIDATIGEFETRLNSFVVPRQIIAAVVGQTPLVVSGVVNYENGGFVDGTPAVAGQDYDMLEVPYDYTTRRFENWSLIQARHRPIISVENLLFALPPSFGILEVPKPWITVDPNSGIIQIVPVQGAMVVTSPGAGMWLPFFTMGQMDYVPQFSQLSYTAGISPVPDDMIDALAMGAAAKVLEVYNLAYYPGIQNFSVNAGGFSQSASFRNGGPFQPTIELFRDRADQYIERWREAHNGLSFSQLG